MEVNGPISGLVTGVIIGGLGRLAVPGRQPIGCLLTIAIGIVGALVGTSVAHALEVTGVVRLLIQVVAAALLVALFSGLSRRT